jgi:hypothetical protein
MVCELGSLILTNWSETMARERGRGFERGITLTVAQELIWMAWQGSACAASQRLPREYFIKHAPGAPHHDASTGGYSHSSSTGGGSASSSSARHRIGGAQRRQIPRGETTQISPERKPSQIPTEGVGRGSGGDHLAQAAMTKITGDGQRDQAAAAAIQLSPESSREERGE